MSLGIAFKGPEGIVLAVDSRVTLFAERMTPEGLQSLPSTFDNATKLLKLNSQTHVGAITYGLGALGNLQPRTAHSFLPEFESELLEELSKDGGAPSEDRKTHKVQLSVEEYAKKLSVFFMKQWEKQGMPEQSQYSGDPMIFLVAGYDKDEVYGRIFDFYIPQRPEPMEQNANDFGMTWGGQAEITSRLINGYDPAPIDFLRDNLKMNTEQNALFQQVFNGLALPIPFQFLPLQDCVDLTVLLVRTTIALQTFQVGVRGVGGAIDVATITRTEGLKLVQEKKIVSPVLRV